MGLLALWCLTISQCLPAGKGREIDFGYLGMQLMLSYVSHLGLGEDPEPGLAQGEGAAPVFPFSAYPVSERLRGWEDRPAVMLAMSWAVMLFEIAFPLTLVSKPSLMVGLTISAAFHLANAVVFGLNRFCWTWLALYPAIWLQDRLF